MKIRWTENKGMVAHDLGTGIALSLLLIPTVTWGQGPDETTPTARNATIDAPSVRYAVVPLSGRSAVSLTNKGEVVFTSGEIFKWDGSTMVSAGQVRCFPADTTITRVSKPDLRFSERIVGETVDSYEVTGTPVTLWWNEALAMNDAHQVLWSTRVVADSEGNMPGGVRRGLFFFSHDDITPVDDYSDLPGREDPWHDRREHVGTLNNRGDMLYHRSSRRTSEQMLWKADKAEPTRVDTVVDGWRYLPVCLNDSEVMAGTATRTTRNDRWRIGSTLPFVHTGGQRIFLPIPQGAAGGRAFGINNRGDTVGSVSSHPAVLWERRQSVDQSEAPLWNLIDLNAAIPPDTGYRLASAIRINDRGMILAIGYDHGHPQSFLLVPSCVDDRSVRIAETDSRRDGSDLPLETTQKR